MNNEESALILEKLNNDEVENIRVENEQKLLSYFIRTPSASSEVSEDWFLHPFSKAIVSAIKRLYEKNIDLDIDTIHTAAQENDKFVTWEMIDGIYKKFNDFNNIKFVIDELKNDYIKKKLRKTILTDFLSETIKKDNLSVEKLQSFAENILYELIPNTAGIELLNTQELFEHHIDIINKRSEGLFTRSLGYQCLNEVITRPAAAEELTILVGQKGSGKCLIGSTEIDLAVNEVLYNILLFKNIINKSNKNIDSLYEITIKIEDLFTTISELETHEFEYNTEYFQNEMLYVKDEYNNWIKIKGLIKKKAKTRKLEFSNGVKLECAEKHLISINKHDCITADFLSIGDMVETADDKLVYITRNEKNKTVQDVYDISVDSETHLYQTSNKIIHHNSIFAKSIENLLINTNVPVLSLNLEMSEQSTMDRLLCIRTGISLEDLQKINMPQETLDTVFRGLGELAKYDNYLYCPMSYMDLSTIDSIIYRAKNIFKQKGVLKEDQYMFVMIDSLDMVKGFGEPYEIKTSIDKLHAIYRKHKCHVFALVQANEQKFRSGKIWTKPEELDSYHITLADIYGGSYYAARARVVMSINRPLHLKMQFFPERMEQWDIEDDILSCSIIKQNDGALARCNFLFDTNFKITQLNDNVQLM